MAGRLLVAVTFCALTVAVPALAQGVAGGLFGALRSDGGGRDKLNVQVSMIEALDSEVPPEFRSFVPANDGQSGGLSTILTASADYARNRRRVQLFGTASTYFRHDQRLGRTAAGSQSAQVGAGVRLPKQGSLRFTQTAAYAPSYLYQLFPAAVPLTPGEAIPVNPEYRIDQTESYSYGTRLALTFGSARGTRVTGTADYGLTDFRRRTTARPKLATYATGAKISRGVTRRGALSAGYEYRTGEFDLGGLTKTHRVTIGVEYSPALSVTRRATFRLDVSPSVIEIPASVVSAVTVDPIATSLDERVPSPAERRLYRLEGEASVEYPFRLRWRAEVSYRRGVEYLAVLSEPVFSNGARARLMGVIGRRVDVSASAGYATAASAITGNTRNLGTYTGQARIRYALTRAFAVYSEYLYYYYDLAEQARLAPGLPSVYEQHGIRVGFTLFAQALGR